MEKYQPVEHDKTAYLLNAIHVQEGEYFSRRVHDDIDGIMEDIRSPQGTGGECAGKLHCRRAEKGFGRGGKL